MVLEPFDIFNIILQAIFVSISIIIGLILISKYPKTKNRTLLLVGLVWIGIALPWFSAVVSALFTISTGDMISVELFLFIAVGLLPLTIFLWFIAFTDLVYNEKQKIILIIVATYGALYEIFFLYFLFMEPSVLGELHGPIHIEYKFVIQIYIFSVLVISLFTGILFARETIKSGKPELKLRGKFLVLAFISFVVASISDSIYTRNYLILLITRIILISSSLEFYCAFALPEWIKKLLLKQEQIN